MDDIFIVKTKSTPEVSLSAKDGKIKIAGRSLSQNPNEFFSTLFTWTKSYCYDPQPVTTIDLILEYYNSTSFKLVLELLLQLKRGLKNNSLVVRWHYQVEDDDLLVQGREVQSYLSIPFEFVSYNES